MRDEHYKKGLKTFFQLLDVAKENSQLPELFNLLLTQGEREDIALRCLLIRELIVEQKTQRDIAEMYQASISKITRGSNSLKQIPSKLKSLLINYFSSSSWRI